MEWTGSALSRMRSWVCVSLVLSLSPTSAGTLGPLLRKPQPYLLHLGTFLFGVFDLYSRPLGV